MAQPLALELYHTVIQHVDKTRDLISLALCCSAFRDEAQRCLFRHVEPRSQVQQARFISSIIASPSRLGPLIHAYCIRAETTANDDLNNHEAHVLLSLALRSMCNLEHLKNQIKLSLTVLQGCVFKLRTLVWNTYADKSDLLFLFGDFLPTQPSIKRLHIRASDPFDFEGVTRNFCPMLNSLTATIYNYSAISALLQGSRIITRFENVVRGDILPAMSIRQLNHLEHLLCGIQALNTDTSFTQQLTSLAFLELHIDNLWLKDLDLLPQKLQFLRDLPCLKVLIVQANYIDDLKFIAAYRHVFKLCPRLEYIDARMYKEPFFDRFFSLMGDD